MEKIKSRACKHQSMLANLNSNRSLSFILLIGGLVFSFPLQTKALTLFSFQESGYSKIYQGKPWTLTDRCWWLQNNSASLAMPLHRDRQPLASSTCWELQILRQEQQEGACTHAGAALLIQYINTTSHHINS